MLSPIVRPISIALACAPALAQLQPTATPTDLATVDVARAAGRLVTMAPIDADALTRLEMENQIAGRPLRFAIPTPVDFTPATHGALDALGDGRVEWTLDVSSPGARSLNFATRFDVPAGVSLYLLDGAGEMVGEVYTSDDASNGELWTRLVMGDFAQIVVEAPAGAWAAVAESLAVTSINVGYLDIFSLPDEGLQGGRAPDILNPEADGGLALRSAACHVDVECPEGQIYPSQVSSVARITIGGGGLCSGSLVNNEREDQTPYFLTAHHCGAWSNPGSVVVYWNYQHSICRPPGSAASGANGNGSLSQNQSGSSVRLTNPDADLTLIELNAAPSSGWNIDFAGFDASGGGGEAGAFSIHHPNGQEKRISIDDQPLAQTFVSLSGQPNIRAWRAVFDIGGIQGGSSGGPLYSGGGRVIGVNTGVNTLTACFPQQTFCGRLEHAWTNSGTIGGLLSDWLDPDATGTSIVDPLFGDIDPPGAFSLQLPANGSDANPLTPTLDWTDAANAVEYEVTIDDDPNLVAGPLLVATAADSMFDVPAGLLAENTEYFWSVTAIGAFGDTVGSPSMRSFTTLIDCNDNGQHDPTDIALGQADDCNLNGVPDSCDVATPPFTGASPQLSPMGSGSPQQHTFAGAPDAIGDVTLMFEAFGDINSPLENIQIDLGGSSIGVVFNEPSGTYLDCDASFDTIVVDAATWNAALASGAGDAVIDLIGSASIDPNRCLPANASYVSVSVVYETDTGVSPNDQNGNGIPDECEQSCPGDVTGSGACTPGAPDGVVDLSDFSCYLAEWSIASAFADITADGTCVLGTGGDGVTLSDFSCYLTQWSAGCP